MAIVSNKFIPMTLCSIMMYWRTNIEGKVIIGKCQTISAVGDCKPQPYGKTDTD